MVLPEALPVCFGRLIDGLANEIRSVNSPIYSAVGEYLTKYWYDKERLIAWAGEVKEKFGHKDGPMGEGKMVFPADMRYISSAYGATGKGRGNYL